MSVFSLNKEKITKVPISPEQPSRINSHGVITGASMIPDLRSMIEKRFIYVNKDYHTLIDFLLCNQQTVSETQLVSVNLESVLVWPCFMEKRQLGSSWKREQTFHRVAPELQFLRILRYVQRALFVLLEYKGLNKFTGFLYVYFKNT